MSAPDKPDSDTVNRPPSPDAYVDARELRCPLPLLRAKQALRNLTTGQRLEVRATDAGSVRDFRAFAELSGHRLETFTENEGIYTYILVKA